MCKKEKYFRFRLCLLLLAAILFGLNSLMIPQASGQKRFDGIEITVFTQPPPFIAKPVQMFRADWQKKTGAKVKLITAPWAELYPKMISSFTMGAKKYDIIIFPAAWLADFAGNNFLVPLDDFIAKDKELAWNDILPVYRERICSYAGKIWAVPMDGDNHIFYYRKDALDNIEYQKKFKDKYGYTLAPPKTWKQHREIAEFFNGWDWDGDGRLEYGVVEAMRKDDQAYWTFFSRAAAYVSIPGQPGGLFFDPNTMEPLINSPGHVKALEDWIKVKQFGVPGVVNMDSGEIRNVFTIGDASMAIDWGDIGVMADTSPESTIKGQCGYTIMPGTTRVWDYKKQTWAEFPKGNQAPYLAFGGWLAAIDAKSDHIEAAYDFISFLGTPENSYISVTTPETGFNPCRKMHFDRLAGWFGYGFVNPKDYLGAIEATIAHDNVQPDLRIPGTARYFEALDPQLAMALAGNKTAKEALDAVAKEWKRITEDIGKDAQLKAYRASLGLLIK
jgi:multiple sugar transport system substrate-binding protein